MSMEVGVPTPRATQSTTRFGLTLIEGSQVIDWVIIKDNYNILGDNAAHLRLDNTYLGTQTAPAFVLSPITVETGQPSHVIGLTTIAQGRLRVWDRASIDRIPSGGASGEVLTKASGVEGDFAWMPPGESGGAELGWPLRGPNGAANAPSYSFSASGGTGMYSPGTNRLGFSVGGTARWEINTAGQWIPASDNALDIGASATASRPKDVYLGGRVLTGNGTAAAVAHGFSASLGTGLFSPAANRLQIATNGTAKWEFTSGGTFQAVTDNSWDIGASGNNRPANVWVARNAQIMGQTQAYGGVFFESTNAVYWRWNVSGGASGTANRLSCAHGVSGGDLHTNGAVYAHGGLVYFRNDNGVYWHWRPDLDSPRGALYAVSGVYTSGNLRSDASLHVQGSARVVSTLTVESGLIYLRSDAAIWFGWNASRASLETSHNLVVPTLFVSSATGSGHGIDCSNQIFAAGDIMTGNSVSSRTNIFAHDGQIIAFYDWGAAGHANGLLTSDRGNPFGTGLASQWLTWACVDHAEQYGLRRERITGAMDILQGITGYSYDHLFREQDGKTPQRRRDGSIATWRDYGFRASEVHKLLPEMVGFDPDGTPDSVEHGHMVAVLWEAVKDLAAEVETLKAKAAA